MLNQNRIFRFFTYPIVGFYALLLVVIFASYLGFLNEKADALSHFRLHFSLVLLVFIPLLTILKHKKLAFIAVGIVVLNTATAFTYPGQPVEAITSTKPVKLMTLNLLRSAMNEEKVLRLIARERPDIILLQEIHGNKVGLLSRLKNLYPWQQHCAFRRSCGVAILSRHPWQQAYSGNKGPDHLAIAWARFDQGLANLRIASVHIRWPFFSDQKSQLNTAYRETALSDQPLIIAGDFNATPWSWTMKSFAYENKLRLAGPLRPTWPVFMRSNKCSLCIPQFAIDHMFVSEKIRVLSKRTGPDVGSDHLPVIIEIALPDQRHAMSSD